MSVQAGKSLFLGNVQVGDVTGDPVTIGLESLRNHVLVTGLPASGKTNTCLQIFRQLASLKIPVLIVEPQRSEYRQIFLDIMGTAGGAMIFSLGDESVAPLRYNPLEILPGVNVLSHIEALRSSLTICFDLSKDTSQLLEKVLYELYSLHGWNLFRNTNHRLPKRGAGAVPSEVHPTLEGLCDCLNSMTLPAHWKQSSKDEINQTLDALLSGGKGLMLNSRQSTGADLIFQKSALLELQAIGGLKERSFVLAMILIHLKEHKQSRPIETTVNHAIIIDDAMYFRNIMGFAKQRIIDIDRSEKQIMFTSLLRELSSLGESVIVSLPLMANTRPDFLHNFSVKIAHRLSPEHGAEMFREPMQLSEDLYQLSSRLKTGTALVSVDDWPESRLVKIPQFTSLSTIVPQSLPESNQDIHLVASQIIDPATFNPCMGCQYWQSGCNITTYDLARQMSLDHQFEINYSKYILSFENDLTQLVHMRADVVQAVQSIMGSRLKDISIAEVTWCALCQATERYFDRLGNEHHIQYNELLEMKQQWLALLAAAFIKKPDGTARQLSIDLLRKFREALQESKKRDQGPHPTCGQCTSKCYYRLDVSHILRDEKWHFDFNSVINRDDKKKKASQQVAWFCMLMCERLIGQRNLDLSYCLAVHFLKGSLISSDAQQVLLHQSRKELEKLLTRPDLRLTPKE